MKNLSLDLGTNAVTCSVAEIINGTPKIIDGQIDRFRTPDGNDNATRRKYKAAKVNRNRKKKKKSKLYSYLVSTNFRPTDKKELNDLKMLDPYVLRRKALNNKLSNYEIGRVLMHIVQRTGYSTLSATDRQNMAGLKKSENGMIGITENENLLKFFKSYGDAMAGQDFDTRKRCRYTTQEMFRAELKLIFETQKEFGVVFPDNFQGTVTDIIFFRRPLKAVEPGKCILEPSKSKVLRSHPLAQEFRVRAAIANLRIVDAMEDATALTITEKEKVFKLFSKHKEVKKSHITKELGVDELNIDSNYLFPSMSTLIRINTATEEKAKRGEGKKETKNKENELKVTYKDITFFTKVWNALNSATSSEHLNAYLKKMGFTDEQALKMCDTSLESGYVNYSLKAVTGMLNFLRAGYDEYESKMLYVAQKHIKEFNLNEAVSELRNGESSFLNYIKEKSGKNVTIQKNSTVITNHVVKRMINAAIKMVDKMIEKHGDFDNIIIEVARDVNKSQKEIDAIIQENKNRRKLNSEAKAYLLDNKIEVTQSNIRKYRLFKECDGVCVYTGSKFTLKDLFGKNGNIQFEHFLSKGIFNLDAEYNVGLVKGNLTGFHDNITKGMKTPLEAYGGNKKQWEEIKERAKKIYNRKKYNHFIKVLSTDEHGFESRALNDTRYITKMVASILRNRYGKDEQGSNVKVINGGIVAQVRKKLEWEKNRLNLFHHLEDASIMHIITRSLIKDVYNGKKIVEPYGGFKEDMMDVAKKIIVKHTGPKYKVYKKKTVINGEIRYSDAVRGKIHDESFYKKVKFPAAVINAPDNVYSKRTAIGDLTVSKSHKIPDKHIKTLIHNHVLNLGFKPEHLDPEVTVSPKVNIEFQKLLKNNPLITNIGHRIVKIKRVKVHEIENTMVELKGKYVLPNNNYAMLVYKNKNNNNKSSIVTYLEYIKYKGDINRLISEKIPTGNSLVAIIKKDDLWEYKNVSESKTDRNIDEGYYRVCKISGTTIVFQKNHMVSDASVDKKKVDDGCVQLGLKYIGNEIKPCI